MHKARSIKKWFPQFVVKELDWPAQSPDRAVSQASITQHQWPDLTNALVAELEIIPAARFQNLMESLKVEWKLL